MEREREGGRGRERERGGRERQGEGEGERKRERKGGRGRESKRERGGREMRHHTLIAKTIVTFIVNPCEIITNNGDVTNTISRETAINKASLKWPMTKHKLVN